MQLEYAEHARLTEYLNHRLEQLHQHEPVLRFYDAEKKLDRYTDSINQVLRELEGQNDKNTKLDNVFYLIPHIFFNDVMAIVNGEALPLPDALLDIPPYLAELERQKKEAEAKRQAEVQAQEAKKLHEEWRRRHEKARQERQEALADQLGISVKTLGRLQKES